MGNRCNTEVKVLTFYDGETEAIDAFADVIRYKIRQRIRDRKNLKITTETGGNVCGEQYILICRRNRKKACLIDIRTLR